MNTLSARLVAIFLAVLLLATLTIGGISYYINRETSISMNSERALGIARAVAASIDAEAYTKVVASGQKNAYWHEVKEYLDAVTTVNDLYYLYILYGYDDENVIYFAEGIAEGDPEPALDFHETEGLDYYDEKILDVFFGEEVVSTDIYNASEWGSMVSGMVPILDAKGQVIGIVGADISVSDVLDTVAAFGQLLVWLVLGISVVIGIALVLYLQHSMGRPIAELTNVAQKIAGGDSDVEIMTQSKTEIGVLADSFRDMVETIQQQAQALKAVSEGDLSIKVVPRSEKDVVSVALLKTIRQLSNMIDQINKLARQVVAESGQIAGSAQSLAKGAYSQAAAVEELSSSIGQIMVQTQQNSQMAEQAASLANSVHDETTNSFTQIEDLIAAVNEISKANNAVRYVLKAIEDIAFQTNILSLNASVVAARAGDNGKSFAVVSKEVQELSRKTTESAKESAALIADTMGKTKKGVELAEGVHAAMMKVVSNVKESSRISDSIARSSRDQMAAIEQIDLGIKQVASVVHQNNAVASESASVSDKLSTQASDLSQLIGRFRTQEEGSGDN